MMNDTVADRIIAFNRSLYFDGDLPAGYQVMNPYFDRPETMQVMEQFYQKFYADSRQRKFLIGINPSRHGAGVTGIPFTDTKRLASDCGIPMDSAHTHEVSSVFIYDMIRAYGGSEAFYRDVYINSPFPLAIIKQSPKGGWLNANYYDNNSLFEAVKPFMVESLKKHIAIGIDTSKVFVLGKKNAQFLEKINREEKLFGEMIPLEHPRYIQQYQSRHKDSYIQKYLHELGSTNTII